jgi:dienelactone hydrolase
MYDKVMSNTILFLNPSVNVLHLWFESAIFKHVLNELFMKKVLIIFWLLVFGQSFAQQKSPQAYGFRHLRLLYKSDTVEVLIKSRKGEEQKPKPLFLFCQGSLPQPLIKFDTQGMYGVFPFNEDSLCIDYHLVIIGKPYIPVVADAQTLGNNSTYTDTTGKFPQKYLERNLLSYYVPRNIEIIKQLQKMPYFSRNKLVVAGHSEGSTIAAKLAASFPQITHLIYSGGNPLGRIMSIIGQSRTMETDTDSTRFGEQEISYWQSVVADKNDPTTYEFSEPPLHSLKKLKIPVLVSYGTRDWSAPFNDYLRVEMIRQNRKNFDFKAYVGTEHNYFPLAADGKINYDIFNWDKVANDWRLWLRQK